LLSLCDVTAQTIFCGFGKKSMTGSRPQKCDATSLTDPA
jgi:hypothetical protein